MDDEMLAKHWPQVAALHRALTSLPTEVTTAVPAPPAATGTADPDFDEKVAEAYLRWKRRNRR